MTPSPVELARGETALEVLSRAVQAPTLSGKNVPLQVADPEAFEKLHKVLSDAYPELYKTVEVETVRRNWVPVVACMVDPVLYDEGVGGASQVRGAARGAGVSVQRGECSSS